MRETMFYLKDGTRIRTDLTTFVSARREDGLTTIVVDSCKIVLEFSEIEYAKFKDTVCEAFTGSS